MMRSNRRQYGTGSVYQRGDGRWVGAAMAGWTERGTRRRITVTGRTEADAKRKLKQRIADMEANGIPIDGIGKATVKSWSDQWLSHTVRTVRPRTYTTNQAAVKKWIVPAIGHRLLAELNPGDIRAVHTAIRNAGKAPATVVRADAVLSKMLKDALVEGHPVPQRVFHVPTPSAGVSDRDAVQPDQAIAILNVAAGYTDGSRWAAAFLQGMRQGECLGLTWDLVDLDRGLLDVSWQLQPLPYVSGRSGPLRVPDGYEYRRLDGALSLVRPKTAQGQRILPLVPWMAEGLRVWRELAPASPHGLVWPRPDGRPRRGTDDRADWCALQDVAEVRHPNGRRYYLHEARHATATLLLEAGVDPKTVETILGHSSIVTSRGYQHVSQALARKAMEAVAERLQLA